MEIVEVIRVVMEQIKETVRSETVIGAAVQSGESVIVPVSKVSFGFGIGGSERDMKKRSGLGTGVGATVEPVAFVVVTAGRAQILPLKSREATLTHLIDLIPGVIETIRGKTSGKRKEDEHAPAPAGREGLKG